MSNLIVVDNPKTWPLHVPGVPLVAAKTYLTEPTYSEERNLRVFNLCRSYRYQSAGYYVSLLAMARGHKPLPSITTIQDMKNLSIARIVVEDLDDLVQRSLKTVKGPQFQLSIYFGRNLAERYSELASRLFRLFPAPLLRAEFALVDEEWELHSIGPIAANDVPESHEEFDINSARTFFSQDRLPVHRRVTPHFELAILHNPDEATPPSNKSALRMFAAAARRQDLGVEFLEREDFGRVAEFDALFIRETTAVHHHTYRFARRAAAEGLVVIDDPDSIAKCANKVYLAELLNRYNVPIPRTLIVHRDNRDRIMHEIGLPCILKKPDSSFSKGVLKVETREQLDPVVDELLDDSDLIIAQEFVPTSFDWRIGVFDRQPLFACRYYMVKEHWQIAKREGEATHYGNIEAVPMDLVPRCILNTAVRAARLIGDGLYGVDAKQFGRKALIIEVNDNPNIDHGNEDGNHHDDIYERIMRVFLQRIQARKNGRDTK